MDDPPDDPVDMRADLERLRREHAAQLRESEERFRALVTASSDAIYRMSADWSEMHNLVGRAFIADTTDPSRSWIDKYIPLEDRPRVRVVIDEAIRTKSVFELEHRVLRVDGTLGWTFSRATPIFDDNGEVVEWFGAASDITQRKQAEELLRESEARYRTLFESIDEGFCVFDMLYDDAGRPVDYRFVEVNPAFEKQTGLIAAKGRTVREMDATHEMHWFEIYGKVAETGEPIRFEAPSAGLNRYFDVYALRFGPQAHRLAAVFTDVSERKRAVNELVAADRRKDEFLAVLSHELRNPLAPISNGLYILDHAPPDSEQARRARQIIGRQVTQLSNLVNDLLDVSRIVSGKVQLHKTHLELNELVRRTVEDNRSLFDLASVALTYQPAPLSVPVHADATRACQIVGNLLQNSAKFTSAGGHTRVSVAVDGDQAVVRVADDGVGISPETMARLFQAFSQAEQTLARSNGGLGLGLALVKGLIELHGGTAEAHSEGIGRGTAMTVRIPLYSQGVIAPTATAARVASPRRRVLIIEDNADAADTLSEILALRDNEVEVAYSGPAGIAKARTLRPDVVLCDIGLPGMDGYEVARAMRADQALAGTLLIALSGYARPEDLRRATEAGFDRHLAKPVNLEKLVQLLDDMPRA